MFILIDKYTYVYTYYRYVHTYMYDIFMVVFIHNFHSTIKYR